MSAQPRTLGVMFDPWGIIAAHPWLGVHMVRMPEGKPGATNGRDTIWLEERMTARERRCVLTHELVHLQYGHGDCQPPKVELKVRRQTAHLLLPWPMLVESVRGAVSISVLAEELHVTDQVLTDRLEALSDIEVETLQARGAEISLGVSW